MVRCPSSIVGAARTEALALAVARTVAIVCNVRSPCISNAHFGLSRIEVLQSLRSEVLVHCSFVFLVYLRVGPEPARALARQTSTRGFFSPSSRQPEHSHGQMDAKQRGGFAERSAKGGAMKRKGGKQSGKARKHPIVVAIATQTRSGEKLCGAFNAKRGCRSAASCPPMAVHQCGVVIRQDGTVCFSKQHGAANHRN